MANDPLYLGVDLGTSSLKCGAFDLSGSCAEVACVAYPPHECADGAEQYAADWWQALVAAVTRVLTPERRARMAAIGVGGHAPSPVFVDAGLRPVSPVSPWFDPRPNGHRERLLRALGRPPSSGPERFYSHVAARAVWLAESAPEVFERVAWVLHSGDYLVARLTGRPIATTPRSDSVIAAAGLPATPFTADGVQPGEIAGRLLPAVAEHLGLPPGIPVVAGGLDSFLAIVGSGLSRPGDSCLVSGSSSVVALVAHDGQSGRFEWGGRLIQSRPIRPGGRLLRWAARQAGFEVVPDALFAAAAGHRSPLRQTSRRMAFLRQAGSDEQTARENVAAIARRASPAELVHLVLVAIFLAQRSALEEMERPGHHAARPRAVGGLASRPDVNQLQADVLGRPIDVPRTTESGALGAAMLAATGSGHCSPERANATMVCPGAWYDPCDRAAARFDRLFDTVRVRADAGSVPG